jgi:hypothetical protein
MRSLALAVLNTTIERPPWFISEMVAGIFGIARNRQPLQTGSNLAQSFQSRMRLDWAVTAADVDSIKLNQSKAIILWTPASSDLGVLPPGPGG